MRLAILVFFMFLFCIGKAQLNGKYTFRHIDQSDGLLHNMVRGIGQDDRGFIWILSLNGLQRYDGSRFVNYPEITRNSSFGIIHDSELYVDTIDDEVWISKIDRIEKLNLRNNQLSTLTLKEFLKTDTLFPSTIFTDQKNTQWWIGAGGLIHFDTDTTKVSNSFFNVNPGEYNRNTYILK
ncbi:MAG: hypothetical protein ABJB16_15695, partial [Saprospiraceae bacterium]